MQKTEIKLRSLIVHIVRIITQYINKYVYPGPDYDYGECPGSKISWATLLSIRNFCESQLTF